MKNDNSEEFWEDEEKEVLKFFKKFNLEVKNLLEDIHKQSSEKQSEIFYLFYKARNIFDVCDYVDRRKEIKHVDGDRFKMFLLISFAENVARMNSISNDSLTLITKFFKNIKNKLKYKIHENKFIKGNMELLYAFRNEYAHVCETSGYIFKIAGVGNCEQLGNVEYYDKNNKKMETINFSVDMSYDEFSKIYLEALLIQIKKYIK